MNFLWYSKNFYTLWQPIIDQYLEWSWNNNWPKGTIFFTTKSDEAKQDVKTVFKCVSNTLNGRLKKLAESLTENCTTNDEKAKVLFKWVRDNIKYTTDQQSHFKVEFWQSPDETYSRKTGDCEDGSILLIKLMELVGIPAFRRKLVTGYIKHRGKDIGHAYVIYLREQYNEWFCLDWCFYPIYCIDDWNMGYKHKTSQLSKTLYGDVWWTTNEKYSWIQHDFMLCNEGLIYNQ